MSETSKTMADAMGNLRSMAARLNVQKTIVEARLRMLETIIADFLRLHLADARGDREGLTSGLTAMSEKLLEMQAGELASRQEIETMGNDLMASAKEQMAKMEAAPEKAVD